MGETKENLLKRWDVVAREANELEEELSLINQELWQIECKLEELENQ